jgi:hypothetical protein
VAALAAALSSGQHFPIATDLFAHPMSIYWRDGSSRKCIIPPPTLAHR